MALNIFRKLPVITLSLVIIKLNKFEKIAALHYYWNCHFMYYCHMNYIQIMYSKAREIQKRIKIKSMWSFKGNLQMALCILIYPHAFIWTLYHARVLDTLLHITISWSLFC